MTGPSYINQIPLSIASDGTPFNGGQGWKTGYRLSKSSGSESAFDGHECTGFIKVNSSSSIIRTKNIGLNTNPNEGNWVVVGYDGNFTKLDTGNGVTIGAMISSTDTNGVTTFKQLSLFTHFDSQNLVYIRLCSDMIDDTSILTVDEEIK